MSGRPFLVDVTRLITRLNHPAPTGIDRVDLAYARRFLRAPYDGRAVAVTPFGPRLLARSAANGLLARLEARWRDEDEGEAAPPRSGEPRSRPEPSGRAGASPRLPEIWRRTAGAFGSRPASAAPEGAVYLHTSHLRLDRPRAFDWLYERPDIRPVFLVHDLIPIEFPEYAVPGEAARHRRRMATVAAHAAAIVTNSADVAGRLERYLVREELRRPPVHPALLGVEPAFRARAEPAFRAGIEPASRAGREPAPGERPYFVLCSTIEARKNHLLVLQVWRDLASRLGPDTPRLVVVGRRGWESEAAADMLDRCGAIRPHLTELSGLSTAGLARLVAGARALLMPSFAEGYGLPVAEALSLGTPVLASDIPVHREVAGEWATFLDPLDGPGWAEAVLGLRSGPPRRVEGYRPPGWDGHFAVLDAVVAGL